MAKTEEMDQQQNSYAYKLGYASMMNGNKIGFALLDLVDKQDSREAVLKVVLDFSRAQDQARDKLKRVVKQPSQEKETPTPKQERGK